MIIVFGSSLYEHDRQNNLLLEELNRSGKQYVFLNPLRKDEFLRIELEESARGINLRIDGESVNATTIYLARLPRLDCAIYLPDRCSYPTLWRLKANEFLSELIQALFSKRWLPGSPSDIAKGESKVIMLHIARNLGIEVPNYTRNSLTQHGNEYRKVLGSPFSISLNTESGEEEAVTLLNSTEDREFPELSGLPWQWQSHIKASAQIRCVAVNGKMHSYIANIDQFEGKSLREAQEDGLEIYWSHCSLPPHLETSVFSLMKELRLTLSCPEFLVTEDGRYVLIDLNPCGDWYGFIDEEENRRIATEIVSML